MKDDLLTERRYRHELSEIDPDPKGWLEGPHHPRRHHARYFWVLVIVWFACAMVVGMAVKRWFF